MLPSVREREKYERVWAIPEYSKFSPGERSVGIFADMVSPIAGPEDGLPVGTVIDFGCGAGAAADGLRALGLRVIGVDHVDIGAGKYPGNFFQANLWAMPPTPPAHYGYCVDVMEHIPIEFTGLVLSEIIKRTDESFFRISTRPDHFGSEIGESLHLTVKPFMWWLNRLQEFGEVRDARDFMHCGVYHVI